MPVVYTPESPDNKAIRELRNSVKDLNKSTKSSSRTMIALTIVLIILAIGLPFYNQFLTKRALERKIIQSDEYNLGIACLILKTLENNDKPDEVPAWQYEVSVYKNNIDFIATLPEEIKNIVQQNIALMDIANNFLLEAINDLRKNPEVRKKVNDKAIEILANIAKSYKIEIDCSPDGNKQYIQNLTR